MISTSIIIIIMYWNLPSLLLIFLLDTSLQSDVQISK